MIPFWAREPLDEPQEPAQALYDLRPCVHCGQPSWMAEKRQTKRGSHPTCTGWLDRLTDDGERRVLFAVCAVLPVAGITVEER